jgi:hypothetical protein
MGLYLTSAFVTAGIGGVVTTALGAAFSGGKLVFSFAATAFSGVASVIVSSISGAISAALGSAGALVGVKTALITAITTTVSGAIGAISAGASGAIGAVSAGAAALAAGGATTVMSAIAGIAGLVAVAAPFIAVGLAIAAVIAVINEFERRHAAVSPTVAEAQVSLQPGFDTGAFDAQDIRDEAFAQTVSGLGGGAIGDAFARINFLFSGTPGTIGFETEQLIRDLEAESVATEEGNLIGANLVEGIVLGVKENQVSADDAGALLMQGLIDRTNDTAGNRSPSKVFKEIALNLILGLSEGLAENSEFLFSTMTEFFKANVLTPVEALFAGGEEGEDSGWATQLGASIPSDFALAMATNQPLLTAAVSNVTQDFIRMQIAISAEMTTVIKKLNEFAGAARAALTAYNNLSTETGGDGIPAVPTGPGRQHGGSIFPNTLHPVIEDGQPELFRNPQGQTFLISPTGGFVTPTQGMSGGQSFDNRNFDNSIQVHVQVPGGAISSADLRAVREAAREGVNEADSLTRRANKAGAF